MNRRIRPVPPSTWCYAAISLLATHYDGKPLTPAPGYPLRGVIGTFSDRSEEKSAYFWKGGKWLRALEFRAEDQPDVFVVDKHFLIRVCCGHKRPFAPNAKRTGMMKASLTLVAEEREFRARSPLRQVVNIALYVGNIME